MADKTCETGKRQVPTKEQWELIIQNLSGLFGSVNLLADGYKLTVRRTLTGKNTLGSVVFVNGEVKGLWMVSHKLSEKNPAVPEEARRFYQPRARSMWSQKQRRNAEKAFGKKCAREHGYYEKILFYSPCWQSATALKRHLLKNNTNITLIKEA